MPDTACPFGECLIPDAESLLESTFVNRYWLIVNCKAAPGSVIQQFNQPARQVIKPVPAKWNKDRADDFNLRL